MYARPTTWLWELRGSRVGKRTTSRGAKPASHPLVQSTQEENCLLYPARIASACETDRISRHGPFARTLSTKEHVFQSTAPAGSWSTSEGTPQPVRAGLSAAHRNRDHQWTKQWAPHGPTGTVPLLPHMYVTYDESCECGLLQGTRPLRQPDEE